MKKILITISLIVSSIAFGATPASDKIILEGVDITSINQTCKSMDYETLKQYVKENKSEIANQIKQIDFKTKSFRRASNTDTTKIIVPSFTYIRVLAMFYEYEDKTLINENNCVTLFAATFFQKNPEKYIAYKKQGFEILSTDKPQLILVLEYFKEYQLLKQYKDQIPLAVICANYKVYKNVFSDEEIFEKLSNNVENLTDEQVKFKNTLFVKLYQKKMLGK